MNLPPDHVPLPLQIEISENASLRKRVWLCVIILLWSFPGFRKALRHRLLRDELTSSVMNLPPDHVPAWDKLNRQISERLYAAAKVKYDADERLAAVVDAISEAAIARLTFSERVAIAEVAIARMDEMEPAS